MFVVDTNVLLYAAEKNFPRHDRCHALLTEWRRQPGAWYLTWKIVYEFVRVATHPKVFAKPWSASEAWRFVESVMAAPGLHILLETSRHAQVAREVFDEIGFLSGNAIHDAHTAILMREHGIRTVITCDTLFHRFPWLDAVEPN